MEDKIFRIHKRNSNLLAIIVKSPRVANKFNQELGGYYPNGTKFKPGEEPLFLISAQEVGCFLNALPKRYDKVYLGGYLVELLTQVEQGGDEHEG